jgi:hypothetical protein
MLPTKDSEQYSNSNFQPDSEIWESLKLAIAESSGFKRWQSQQELDSKSNIEQQVSRYLRETLNTLAY